MLTEEAGEKDTTGPPERGATPRLLDEEHEKMKAAFYNQLKVVGSACATELRQMQTQVNRLQEKDRKRGSDQQLRRRK